ncbi:MAG: hypothetical protein J6K40_05190 [Alistipes sp.]|nr:hypothetical protein [Alistipes sp.]
MKRIILIIVVLVVAPTLYGQNIPEYHNEAVEASADYQQGNAFQQDLLLYADMLSSTHPYYADAKHRKGLERRVRRVYKECGKIEDVADFKLSLARLAASLGDGHTAISFWSNLERIFPVRLALDINQPAIVDVTSEERRELLGKEVKAINGRSLKQILRSAREIVSADNDVNFLNLVKEYLMFAEFWSFLDMSDECLTLTFADGSSAEISAISKRELRIAQLQRNAQERVTAMRNTLFDYTIFEDGGICYLQFNQFADRVTMPQYPQLARFDEFVAAMMAEIEAKGVETLVVDLQYNSGGNSNLGEVLLSWLKPYAEIESYGVDVRISKMLLERYPYYRDFTFDGEPLKMGEVYDMWQFDHNRGRDIDYSAPQDSSQHILNFDAERIFRGNVVFVEGQDSYSSATLLLTKARDCGVGIIVGEPSGGKPSHYGDLLYCTLPNTKTIATVSHKHFVRPSREAKESDYITPDVFIELNDPDRDQLWEWVLKTYKRR